MAHASLWGQTAPLGLPPIHSYTKQDYGAETQNWAIAQDARGLLYFGNNLGLLEYDGTAWTVYPLPNRSIVRSLTIDESGTLLVGGQDELGYFAEGERGMPQFHSLTHLLPAPYQKFEDVWRIFSTPEHTYWGTHGALFLHGGVQDTTPFTVIPAPGRFDNFFWCQGKMLVSDLDRGIFMLDGDSLQLLPGSERFVGQHIAAILPHPLQGWLVLTRDAGIYHYLLETLQPWAGDLTGFFAEHQIYHGIALAQGGYAIGTSQQGVVLLDADGNWIQTLNEGHGLLNNSVLSVFEDRRHNLWLGLENGLAYIEVNSPFAWLGQPQGIRGTAYASLIFRDTLYLGTNQGLFFRPWQRGRTTLNKQPFQLVPQSKTPNWGLSALRGQLLVSQHLGPSRLSRARLQRLAPHQGSWTFVPLVQHPGYALEGTYEGVALYRWQESAQRWTYQQKIAGFDESARVMVEDSLGSIWISHAYRGVYRLHLGEDPHQLEALDFFGQKDGLPSDFLINVTRINGEVMFTTEAGVYCFDAAKERFVPHRAFQSAFSLENPVHRLIQDDLGNIWYAAGQTFGCFRPVSRGDSVIWRRFSINRLQKRLVKGFEHIFTPDAHHVFIGTEEGFITLDLAKALNQQAPFPVYLRKVEWMGRPDSAIFRGAILENLNEPLHLPPDARDFRFSYSATFFGDLEELHYQYRLIGLDESWSDWTQKTEKEYTNLDPGTYTFEVRTRNMYGNLSEVASLSLTIARPWYARTGAIVVYVLLGIGGILFLFRLNARNLEAKTEALQTENARALQKQEAEFRQEAQRSEAEIIRLRNEKLEVEVAYKNRELASSAMHLLQKGEVLLKIKQELEELAKEASPSGRKQIQKLIRVIKDDIRLDKNWKQFEIHFDQVHGDFLAQLRAAYPELTARDQRLCAYLRMNFSTKEIAQLMNISVRGVEISRYRLRKKLGLDREQNLNAFMMDFQGPEAS